MSARIETEAGPNPVRPLALLAGTDATRPLAWRRGVPVPAAVFAADVAQLAAALPSAAYVVNLCEDRYRFLVAFCAAAVAGQTNLLPPSRAPQAVADVLQAYPRSYVLSDAAVASTSARVFVMADPASTPATPMSRLPDIDANHVVAIGFTSGSTGAPKANPKTWGAVCASSAFNAALLCGAGAAHIVATVPPQHMYGLEMSVLLPLRSAASIHAGHPFFPADVAAALAAVPAPRLLVTTPFHLRALMQDGAALPTVAAIVSATAPLDVALARAAEERYRTDVVEVFGSTETCVIAHRRTAREDAWQLYDGVELHPQPDGTLVSAPYFAAPTLLQDVVELLPERRFLLRGRNSDLLEIAGKRASLGELTRRLLAIPGVEDGVVFQQEPDANGVARLAALAVAPGLRETDIASALRAAIDPVFLPRPLRLIAALPRNGAGKLPREDLLRALRDP
ncbi:MAG TPA: AMP-binding protein [Rudaea sp.]|nr:AMP-binding protein [Rudaea sp.]